MSQANQSETVRLDCTSLFYTLRFASALSDSRRFPALPVMLGRKPGQVYTLSASIEFTRRIEQKAKKLVRCFVMAVAMPMTITRLEFSCDFGEGGGDYEILNNIKNGISYFVNNYPSPDFGKERH